VLDVLVTTTPATVLVAYLGEDEVEPWLDALSDSVATADGPVSHPRVSRPRTGRAPRNCRGDTNDLGRQEGITSLPTRPGALCLLKRLHPLGRHPGRACLRAWSPFAQGLPLRPGTGLGSAKKHGEQRTQRSNTRVGRASEVAQLVHFWPGLDISTRGEARPIVTRRSAGDHELSEISGRA
jgi:hypothetical protein